MIRLSWRWSDSSPW